MSLLEDITARGAEIRTRLRQLLPRHATGDTKTDWLIGSMDIALEHHEAVERLVKSNLNGSAFSVVRMVFDTFLRSLWLKAYATEARMKQACRDKLKWPKMEEMRDEIRQAQTIDVFRSVIESGVTKCDEIAAAMKLENYEVSRMAKKAMDAGWLDKPKRGEYVLKEGTK